MIIDWGEVSAYIATIVAVGVVVWRFAHMEASVKRVGETLQEHHQCQHMLVKAISRLNMRVKKSTRILEKHINETKGKQGRS